MRNNDLKSLSFLLISFITILLLAPVAGAVCEVSAVALNASVLPGENITLNITVDPDVPISGVQFDLHYDPSFVTFLSVVEGDLFNGGGTPTLFLTGEHDQINSSIKNVCCFTLGGIEINDPGILAILEFSTNGDIGTCGFDLSNVVASDHEGAAVAISIANASVNIGDGTTESENTSVSNDAGGGGGGGGGADSGEDFANIASRDVSSAVILMGTPVSYPFGEAASPLLYVNFTALVNAGTIKSTVEVLHNVSSAVPEAPDGLIYRCMNIWVGNAGFSGPVNIEDPCISFSVDTEWLDSNGLDASDIGLYRYDGSEWVLLDTKISAVRDTRVHYTSKVPDFSYFAIVADTPDVIMSDISAEDIPGDSEPGDLEKADTDGQGPENEEVDLRDLDTQNNEKTSDLAFNSAFILACAMFMVLYISRSNRK